MMDHKQMAPAGAAVLALAMGLTLWAPTTASAAEPEDDANVPGEVTIKTNVEFVKFTVDGKSNWENHEYINRRKTLVIMGLTRDRDHQIVLTPRAEGYTSVTITLTEGDYKRKRVRQGKRRVAIYRAVRTVKFKKGAPPKAGAKAPKGKPDKAPNRPKIRHKGKRH